MDVRSVTEIVERVAAAPRVLLLLDFDGTLAPFVDLPSQARLAPPAREALEHMIEHPHVRVGIVSARSLADVTARVGLPGVVYAGNHGLEIAGGGLACTMSPPPLAPVLAAVRESVALCEGAWVEDKTLTATVHFRGARPEDRAELERIVRWIVDASPGHRWRDAAEAIEIVPRDDCSKGLAVLWIRQGLGWDDALTIYAGDDPTDEDAFVALPEALTIKIGDGPTKARYSAATPEELWRLLSRLAAVLGRVESSYSR